VVKNFILESQSFIEEDNLKDTFDYKQEAPRRRYFNKKVRQRGNKLFCLMKGS
jgi:hypothetical protein